ncbi:bifunctional cobalt-precorrin-7 (C(5))-methyltransferase/cobalt-precorrin-6B (C(15))-methyltransferase [Nocardiopsis sp. NRRL B-16309]|uniref:bifunctional cobalt-precorrin-7 (C(5))-methyltransferase/cobalt-precorrin-6B (C(15))-methyltransferase n=1 Tax=Nocardiopsis sp. NRRL B-16309 TaxID=1519494 RepID=UPI0006AFE48B|nr:bifunctional cobalt-precorrin-7 (C(5))-methyltransferase/cobalt-precorrin-6B (C(15))-methyltransferase [Nocardiopsis sp. NRRL B-16309]KOX08790.1 precorrin-6Y methyltransferase [Nocardiopsis sp. NRRL B-16309]
MQDDPPPPTESRITVVGVGADGWSGVPERLRRIVLEADAVLGGHRHLAMLPERPGQRRETWPSPLREGLPDLLDSLARDGATTVALASGDPFVSGIGTTLVDLLGAGAVRVEPAVSSVALARARMGWPAERCAVVSLVGRDPRLVLRRLAPGHRVLVLSSDGATPAAVAALLAGAGYGASRMTVLGDLGAVSGAGPGPNRRSESRLSATADAWLSDPPEAVPALHVLALELVGPPGYGLTTGLPDDAFEHDGQLTKRDLRASALARLAPSPGEHLWDVGAGAGSVGIEWMRAHTTCTATAVESHPARAARIDRNAGRLGVPGLSVVTGRAPDALAGLPAPDAVFVGGGATRPGVLEACLGALRPGGRLVVHGVTLETEHLLADAYRRHGGELTRIAVETAAPIGTFTGWAPARTVTQWFLAS